MNYAVPKMVDDLGQLSKFYTDFPRKSLPKKLRKKTRSMPVTLFFWPFLKFTRSETSGIEELINLMRSFIGQLWILLTSRKDEVIYTFNSNAFILIFFGRKIILEATIAPKVIECRNIGLQRVGIFKKMYSNLEIYEYRNALNIVAPSQWVKSGITSLVGDAKIYVCEYGVNQQYWKTNIEIKREDKQVVFVGKFGKRKGADLLVKLATANPTWSFKIAGEVSYRSEFPDNMTFLGKCSRDEVRALFWNSTCLVLPSRCEGSATVFYEAGSCGLPILASSTSGLPLFSDKNLILDFTDEISLDEIVGGFEERFEANLKLYSIESYYSRLKYVIDQTKG